MCTSQNGGHITGRGSEDKEQCKEKRYSLPTRHRLLVTGECYAKGCVQGQKNLSETEYLVFKEILTKCAHLMTCSLKANSVEHYMEYQEKNR